MLDKRQNSAKKFLHRYNALMDYLRDCILTSKDADRAIRYASAYGEMRMLNHDGVYADEAVELHIQSLVEETGLINGQSLAKQRAEGAIIIATDIYDYGGHTKVLLTWLRLVKEELRHKLLITRAVTERTQNVVADLNVELIRISGGGLQAILSILNAAQGSNRIVMMIHPQDIVAAVAARILAGAGYQVIFYNHADHLFSYGIGAAATVCEISAYGEAINEKAQRVRGKAYRLGVPLKQNKIAHIEDKAAATNFTGNKVVFSAGAAYKYQPDDSFIFADALDQLLARRSDVNIILVGPTGQEAWWRARSTKWGERVKFYGTLQQAEYMQLMQSADVYVDSYPVTGGTAFPEALLAGKACTGLITPVQGYTLADHLKVDSAAALVVQIEKLLDDDAQTLQQIEKVRAAVIAEQNEGIFKSRILSIYTGNIPTELPPEKQQITGIDISWLEKKWNSDCNFTPPRRKTISRLPISSLPKLMWVIFRMKVSKVKSTC